MNATSLGKEGKEGKGALDRPRFGSESEHGTPHTDDLKDNLTDAGSNLRQAASNAGPAAKEQMGRISESVQEQAQSIEASISQCIRERPINSMLIAAGVGMVFGLVFFRR